MSQKSKKGANGAKKNESKKNEQPVAPQIEKKAEEKQTEQSVDVKELAKQMFSMPDKPHFTKKNGEIERKFLTMMYNVDSLLHFVSNPEFDATDEERGGYIKSLLDAKEVIKAKLEQAAKDEHQAIEESLKSEKRAKASEKNLEKADTDTILSVLKQRGIDINKIMPNKEADAEGKEADAEEAPAEE